MTTVSVQQSSDTLKFSTSSMKIKVSRRWLPIIGDASTFPGNQDRISRHRRLHHDASPFGQVQCLGSVWAHVIRTAQPPRRLRTNSARRPPRCLRSPVAPHPHEFALSRFLAILTTLFPFPFSRDIMRFSSFAILSSSLAVLVAAGPIVDKRASFTLQNGKDAQKLNAKFSSLSASSACQSGEVACIKGAFAQCVNDKFVTTPCSGGLTCVALPLVNSPGTRFVRYQDSMMP